MKVDMKMFWRVGALALVLACVLRCSAVEISSGLVVFPNPSFVNLYSQFTIVPKSADALVTWDFGDGAPIQTGASTSHVYTVGTAYSASVTVNDPDGSSLTIPFTQYVEQVPEGEFDTTDVGNRYDINFGRVRAKPGYVRLIGTIPSSKSSDFTGNLVTVTVNGLTLNFTLNKNRSARTRFGSVRIEPIKHAPNYRAFSIELHGNIASELTQTALTDSLGRPKTLMILLNVLTVAGADIATPFYRGNSATGRFGAYYFRNPVP
jgi:hypothetical protein